jgi:DNA polymerase III alpha subunit
MEIDKFGRVELTSDEAFTALYSGIIDNLNSIWLNNKDEVEKFNSAINLNADNIPIVKMLESADLDQTRFDSINQSNWFMPDEYKKMDIEGYLIDKCPKQNHQRLIEELKLYKEYNMINLLRYLKYLVDTMREHNIVWGVGRGSSVSSYVLYLIGIHKIDSIKYKLDMSEFLKEKTNGI